MNKITKFITIISLSLLIVNPALVFADAGTTTTAPTSSSTNPEYKGVDQSIQDYLCTPSATADGHDLERCINRIYRFSVSFGAIALVFFIVLAGYFYLTGGETGKAKGKGILQNALIGMAFLLGSYVLLSFINPSLVIIKPIQPPIFTANELPQCKDLGFGENCFPEGEYYDKADIPNSSGCQTTFASEAQAKTYMTTVSIKVWDGLTNKNTKTIGVEVQKCLAAKVKAVFDQIYASPEKPLIKSVGGFTWRQAVGSTKLSTHSFGLTVDINWEENYYIKGGKTVGKYWKPCPGSGCDPYSLPANGAVVKDLKAAGFGWGGEWKSLKDYMHFSCHPKEYGKCF